MRFTKCDVCTLANEALDVERRKGGAGWCTAEMELIKRHLHDHYDVSQPPTFYTSLDSGFQRFTHQLAPRPKEVTPPLNLLSTIRRFPCALLVHSHSAQFVSRHPDVSCAFLLPVHLFLQDVKRSRRAYMGAKMQACTEPSTLLCIAIDGADQSAFSTPFFCQETKESVRGWKMRLKLLGALVSGRMCMFFTLAANWESGKLVV